MMPYFQDLRHLWAQCQNETGGTSPRGVELATQRENTFDIKSE